MKKIILSILMAMGVFNSCTAQSPVKILEPEEFIAAAKADTSAVILDVRQPSEYADGHLKGAINLNFLDSDAFAKGISALDKKRTYYLYCRSGRRSNAAATKNARERVQGFRHERRHTPLDGTGASRRKIMT